jgi:hypothetical protein
MCFSHRIVMIAIGLKAALTDGSMPYLEITIQQQLKVICRYKGI